jgi:hypothetical protein
VARAIQARARVPSRGCIENIGKWALDETGKDPVKEDGEEIFVGPCQYETVRNVRTSFRGDASASNPESRDSGFALSRAPE